MQCTVIVRLESATRFVACPVGLLQLESTAPTEADAVEQVKQKLAEKMEELRAQGARIGTLDLRIAATALVHDFGVGRVSRAL